MKKILTISFASFFIPFYIFIALLHSSLPHIYYTSIPAHSALLVLICSTAFSICYFYYVNYAKNKDLPFFVVALFFLAIGFTMFFHAITIPTFYFLNEHIFDITEHIGLLLSGLALLVLFVPAGIADSLFFVNRKKVLTYFPVPFFLWFILLVFSSEATDVFFKYINQYVFLSGVLLVVGTVALLKRRSEMAEYASFPYLVAGLSMMINLAIIPFFYKEWNVVWWYFHAIILCSEIVIFIGIIKRCCKKYDGIS